MFTMYAEVVLNCQMFHILWQVLIYVPFHQSAHIFASPLKNFENMGPTTL